MGFVLRLPYDPERVRGPDVAFVAAARLPEGRLPRGFLSGSPELAVEVLSPTDNPVDIQQKVRDYLEAGGRLVWVVAPEARTVTVYRAGGCVRLLREAESLDGRTCCPASPSPSPASSAEAPDRWVEALSVVARRARSDPDGAAAPSRRNRVDRGPCFHVA